MTFAILDTGELQFKELMLIVGMLTLTAIMGWGIWAIYPFTAAV